MSMTCSEVTGKTDVPDLIPARMLNEFAYCPRLAYLEWVQGEFADNLETFEGRFGHRRVDRESTRPVPEPGKTNGLDAESDPADGVETIHSRSLMLSAPDEGLIAKMDLVDIDASTVIPVDYKRGRVPNVPGGVWEPEQVQICAQGLVLRENGYHCEGGIIYFIESRRRVSVPLDEDLVERTRRFIREMRAMAASGTMPPPLIDYAFHFENRNRRPPRDPINALLSFVYAILTKELTITLYACGFDPMLGFYHRPRYGRPSLALDLAEEFRALIADSVVLRLINNGEISGSQFISRAGAVALTAAGRRAVLAGFERRMDTLVRHPIFKYRISYRRVLQVQARLLARTVLGEIEQYPSFSTR